VEKGQREDEATAHDPDRHHRRSVRLRGYDYHKPGAYFVTVCAKGQECIFGEIVDGQMAINDHGRIVQSAWDDLPNHFPGLALDAFVVMPNHVHGIVVIAGDDPGDDVAETVVGAGFLRAPDVRSTQAGVGAGLKPARTVPARTVDAEYSLYPARQKRYALPENVRAFKTFSARRINAHRETPGRAVWQRSYYEHIIRDLESLRAVREYIAHNPAQWVHDRENPLADGSWRS